MFGFGGSISDAFSGAVNAAADAVASGIGEAGEAYSAAKDAQEASSGRGGGPSPSSPAGGAQAASGYAGGSRGGDGASNYGGPSPSSPAGGAQAAGSYSGGGRDAPSSFSGTSGLGGLSGALDAARAANDAPASYSGGPAAPMAPSAPATGFAPTFSGGIASALGAGNAANAAVAPTGFAPSQRAAETSSMRALGELSMPTSARAVENHSMAKHQAWQGLLDTIKRAEASRNVSNVYNSVVYDWTKANLVDMTISQVQQLQRDIISQQKSRGIPASSRSSAVGAYQMIQSTLSNAVAKLGLDPQTTKFSRSVQDQLAKSLIEDRAAAATRNGVIDPTAFANQLSKEWAGFPNSSGRSSHHGVGSNAATIGWDAVFNAGKQAIDTGAIGNNATVAAAPASAQPPGGFAPTPNAGPVPAGRPDFAAKYLDAPQTSTIADPDRRAAAAYMDYGRTRSAAPAEPTRSYQMAPATGDFLTAPEAAPQNSPQPETSTQVVTVEPAQTAVTPPSQTTAGKIVAGGIDVLSGIVPGIGTAVGAVNLGLSLTGNRTIGQRAVDWMGNLPGEGGKMASGSDGPNMREPEPEEESTVPKAVRDFEEKYLRNYDEPWRPKPMERWGRAA